MEAQLAHHGIAALYQRFPAADGNVLQLPNSHLTESEIGCFTSHYLLLKGCLGSRSHIHVMEDDAVISDITNLVIEQEILSGRVEQYDMLFTNTGLWLQDLEACRRYWDAANITRTSSGRIVSFVAHLIAYRNSASSYIVNYHSIPNLLRILEENLHNGAKLPIDLLLRTKVERGEIKAMCIFPFVTTVLLDDVSAIEGRNGDVRSRFSSDMIRQSFFVNRDLDKLLRKARMVLPRDETDAFAELLGHVLAFRMSREYTPY